MPGRGATLSAVDELAAFESLQTLLNSKAVSNAYQPGIRRHFFAMTPAQSIFTYGPGGQFDTDTFHDPAPIDLEDCYIRSGATITFNETVDEWNFVTLGEWVLAGAGVAIANQKLTLSGAGSASQTTVFARWTAGTTYTLRVTTAQRAGDVELSILQDGAPILTQTLSSSSSYEFEFTFAGTSSAEVRFTTAAGSDDIDIISCSIIETGLDRASLPDGQGTDYSVRIIDQRTYNAEHTKGLGGRPHKVLFDRQRPLPRVRFDHAAIGGDIVVFDALVNQLQLTDLSDEINLHDDAMRYVEYALAAEEAPTYGKGLTAQQAEIMREAREKLQAGSSRPNSLRVDTALRGRHHHFDINRGDP